MTTFLIQKGAPLNALNEEKMTAFALALDNDNVGILETLCAQVKISESPSILHEFESKIFDDRYKSVLIKLLKRESEHELTPEKLDILNADGFTPFLAYVKSFIGKRDELMAAIGRELNYQEYLHKERIANYSITNINLFKSRAEQDKAYLEHQLISAVK